MFKKALFSLFVLSFIIAPLALNAQSADDIAQLIAKLEQQIAYLKQQLAQLQGNQSGQWCYTFDRNLGVGMMGRSYQGIGSELASLQDALSRSGFSVKQNRAQMSEAISYDENTAAAVSSFQLKYKSEILTPLGLSTPTGYVGPSTRAVLNRLYGCKKPIIDDDDRPMPTPVPIVCSGLEMVWDSVQGFSTRREPYSYQTDLCDGYRRVVGNTVSPACYNWQECLSIGGGTCVNIAKAKSQCSVTGNKPPTISGVSGPTTLKIGETGTWTVQASDPENGPLSHSVIWGDEAPTASGVASAPTVEKIQQTATFTHSYAQAGAYYPKFKVTDNAGQSNSTSLSVVVGQRYGCYPQYEGGPVICVDPPPPGPTGIDLSVKNFTLNSNGPYGTFCNLGNTYLKSFPFSIIVNNVQRDFDFGPAINPGRCNGPHQWYYATWGFNAMTSSGYEGKVIVDPKNIYAETNEENNEAKASFIPTPTVNQPPKIVTPSGNPIVSVSETVNISLIASDPDGDRLSMSVEWGDNTGTAVACPAFIAPHNDQVFGNQELKASHIYSAAKTYNVTARVVDCRGGEAKQSLNVEVKPLVVSTLQVLSPNGGESWIKGNTQTISWGATGAPEVSVYLIKDSDPLYRLAIRHNFVSGRANSIEWTVTDDTATSAIAAGSDYRIWVIGGGATAVDDKSDRPFSIATP